MDEGVRSVGLLHERNVFGIFNSPGTLKGLRWLCLSATLDSDCLQSADGIRDWATTERDGFSKGDLALQRTT